MDCQCCQKKPAQIRVCDIAENAMSAQFNVCPECWVFFKRYLFDAGRPLMATAAVLDEVRALRAQEQGALALPQAAGELVPAGKPEEVPVCPECGMTLSEFKQKGRFGCARDYEVFGPHLEKLLERVHDVTPPRHKGRRPKLDDAAEAGIKRGQDLATLRRKLTEAVALENYELAAKLRDEINEVEKTLGAKA